MIYLQAPVKVLCERIAQRGIGYEQTVDTDYLRALVEAYGEFFASYDRRGCSSSIRRALTWSVVMTTITRCFEGWSLEAGRHYFNPRHGEPAVAAAGGWGHFRMPECAKLLVC